MRRKGNLYAAADVPEYWVIDILHRLLQVYRNPVPDASAEFGHSYSSLEKLGERETVAQLAAPAATPIVAAALLP